jgi:hypothetical protein
VARRKPCEPDCKMIWAQLGARPARDRCQASDAGDRTHNQRDVARRCQKACLALKSACTASPEPFRRAHSNTFTLAYAGQPAPKSFSALILPSRSDVVGHLTTRPMLFLRTAPPLLAALDRKFETWLPADLLRRWPLLLAGPLCGWSHLRGGGDVERLFFSAVIRSMHC